VVLGNEAGLTQCFSNPLGNAVKFVQPGRIPEVRVWAEVFHPAAAQRRARRGQRKPVLAGASSGRELNLRRKMNKLIILFLVGVSLAAAPIPLVQAAGNALESSPPSLRNAARGLFEIGVGVTDWIPSRPQDLPLLREQFTILTPENCMKPAHVQRVEGQYDFAMGDAFVDFAVQNQFRVCGHCLVWAKDDRTPAWFFRDGDAPVSREKLLTRMNEHIRKQVERYRGRIAMWDVVNEALDDGTNFLRPSGWVTACGEDFIAEAFRTAHAADPAALLIYNDYNNEASAKRQKTLRLARSFLEQKVPIHALGLQGHYELDRVPFDDIEATILAVKELGLKVVVSELDIDVIPRSRWWADGGKHREELARLDPYRDGCPPEILRRQAEQYAQLFRIFKKHSATILRVSFWDLHDGQSWLNGFPWRRVNHPLLFDRQGKPKPAFHAVMQVLTESPAR
jgi:endo-1,4-beta-xylanase